MPRQCAPERRIFEALCGWRCATREKADEHLYSANRTARRSRRPNGATQTFRRSSASTSLSSINPQQEPSSAQAPPRYVPPHRNGTVADTRYSKDQLLDLFKAQQTSEDGLRDGLPSLYTGGWQPNISNGAASAGWGRTEHSRDAQPGPDICWDRDGTVEPLGLTDMDDEEREVRSIRNSLRDREATCPNNTLALCDVREHATQAAVQREQGESVVQWHVWQEGLAIWADLLSRHVWTSVADRESRARTSPGYKRILPISHC